MRLLECAKILTTHGIRGEVKIKIETDDITRFDKGMELYIGTEEKKDATKFNQFNYLLFILFIFTIF